MSDSKKVVITGATGLIGSALVPILREKGYHVTRVMRHDVQTGDVLWNPPKTIERNKLEGCDAVVHLSGENLSGGRWTETRKQRIWSSRVDSTRFLCETLCALKKPPQTMICASGTAAYGDGDDEAFAESGPPPEGFMGELVQAWEQAAAPAVNAGMRVVHARTGIVLTPRGGMLKSLVPAFRVGLGAAIAPGTQYFGWIGFTDMIAAILFSLNNDGLAGAVNFVSPQPVTQNEFAKTLGHILQRPVLLKLPPWILRTMYGPELMAATIMSQRVMPEKLLASGFQYQYPTLESALRHELDT